MENHNIFYFRLFKYYGNTLSCFYGQNRLFHIPCILFHIFYSDASFTLSSFVIHKKQHKKVEFG